MDKKLKATIISSLRKISYQAPNRKKAMDRVKTRDLVGNFKNGKPKYLNQYKCNLCKKKFKSTEIQVDHIAPVIDPTVGFRDWNTYMSRLFCELSNLQVLCKRCHNIKTKRENQ